MRGDYDWSDHECFVPGAAFSKRVEEERREEYAGGEGEDGYGCGDYISDQLVLVCMDEL